MAPLSAVSGGNAKQLGFLSRWMLARIPPTGASASATMIETTSRSPTARDPRHHPPDSPDPSVAFFALRLKA